MKKIQYWSFGMDYETDEIVINTISKDGEKIQLRACEKDIKSMQSWFDLAKHMKKLNLGKSNCTMCKTEINKNNWNEFEYDEDGEIWCSSCFIQESDTGN